jgi:hypothetical protein
VAETTSAHSSIGTAQSLALASLPVPNTESHSLAAGDTFNVGALAVTGQIGIDSQTGHSQTDFYSVHGRKGDVFTIEVLSTELTRLAGNTIDSVLRVYDSTSHLVPYYGGVAVNDDQFEPTDSALFDLILPADGTYYIEVATFVPDLNPNDAAYNPIYDPLSPSYARNNPNSILNSANPNFDSAALARFLNVVNNTTTGDYELFLYKFGATSSSDQGDVIAAGSGNETVLAGPGADNISVGNGHYVVDFGDGSAAFPTISNQSVSTGSLVTLAPSFGDAYQISWQIVGPNSQTVKSAVGSMIQFVPALTGVYNVNYTVTGTQGDTLSAAATVTAVAPPSALVAHITGAPSSMYRGSAVTLGSQVLNATGTVTYSWQINGVVQTGTTGSSFVFNPATAGSYQVALTATDSTGSYSDVVTIAVLPSVQTTTAVSTTLSSSVYGQSVSFTTTVSAPSSTGVTPAGYVQFAIDGNNYGSPVQLVVNGEISTATSVATTALTAGTHTVVANYLGEGPALTSSGTLTGGQVVGKASLSVTADSFSRIYGATNPTFTATISGFVNGDTSSVISGGPSFTTSATTTSPVGTYAIVPSAGTLGAANYNFAFVNGTLTITLAPFGATSVYILSGSAPGALTVTGNAQLRLQGDLVVDSNSSSAINASGNGNVSANSIRVVGQTQLSNNAQIAPAPVTGVTTVPDPLSSLAAPTSSGLTTYSAVNLTNSNSQTINPGIYPSISVSGSATLTMNPGLYVIAGGGFSVTGNGNVTGNGVTIYNTGTSFLNSGGTFGNITLSGNGNITLMPMGSGTYAGILIFQARDNTKTISLSGNGMVMPDGVIYAPSAAVNMTGNGQFNGSLDVNTLTLTGSSIAQLSGDSNGNVVFTPAQIRSAYGLNSLSLDGTEQTIAIVDAYHTPDIYEALDLFDSRFGLTNSGPNLVDQYGSAASFLTVVNQDGQSTNLPRVDPVGAGVGNWEMETMLDVEWAHAIAPGARIILVETNGQSLADLMAGVRTAAGLPGVSVVSMSWGMAEGQMVTAEDEQLFDSYMTTPAGHQGVTFVASTGDFGALYPVYPAFSPNVVAVGGTSLVLNSDNTYHSESGWGYSASDLGGEFIGSGGGLSRYSMEPAYQLSVQSTGHRSTPDVSFVADPSTGTWIADPYNRSAEDPWEIIGGTSLSAPCWSALFLLANQGRTEAGRPTLGSVGPTEAQRALYTASVNDFNDISTGTNDGYTAGVAYDLVTGLGTPIAGLLIPDLVSYDGSHQSERAITVTGGNNNLGSIDGNSVTVFHARLIGLHGGSTDQIVAPIDQSGAAQARRMTVEEAIGPAELQNTPIAMQPSSAPIATLEYGSGEWFAGFDHSRSSATPDLQSDDVNASVEQDSIRPEPSTRNLDSSDQVPNKPFGGSERLTAIAGSPAAVEIDDANRIEKELE